MDHILPFKEAWVYFWEPPFPFAAPWVLFKARPVFFKAPSDRIRGPPDPFRDPPDPLWDGRHPFGSSKLLLGPASSPQNSHWLHLGVERSREGSVKSQTGPQRTATGPRRSQDFILQKQAQFAASMQRREEERIEDEPGLAELKESFQRLEQLLEKSRKRLRQLEEGGS